MSTFLPNILIGLGALIVAAGALLTQKGWNDLAEVRVRQAAISTIVSTIDSNRRYLDFAIEMAAEDSGKMIVNPNYPPVETATFSSAISGGLFAGAKHDELRDELRKVYISLAGYNQVAPRQFAQPEQVTSYAQYGHRDSNRLARILVDQYNASITIPEPEPEPETEAEAKAKAEETQQEE